MKSKIISRLGSKCKQILQFTVKILVEAFKEWIDDKAFKMSAAVSFYSLFSLFPLLIIIVTILGKIYGTKAIKGELIDGIKDIIGQRGAETVQALLGNLANQEYQGLTILFGSLFIIISSMVVFVELKESMNVIWGVEPKPGQALKNLIRDRALAFIMVLTSALVFFAGLVFDSLLKAMDQIFESYIPEVLPLLKWLNILPQLIITILAIALIFRILPDVKVKWRYLWVGALATSVLFFLGRYLISFYLGHSSWVSVYGAAGSLVALLLWIYYSALIFFFGVELTQVLRHHFCEEPLKVSANAVLITKTTKQVEKQIRSKAKG